MLFLGSEKYPIENHYKQFLNKNSGTSNAGTSMYDTCYYFDIKNTEFSGALDIFSQFFKAPLFHADSVSRELNAVDSEDSKNRILDSRRLLQVLKHLIHAPPLASDYAKFSTGNIQTLAQGDADKFGPVTREAMMRFYERHYGRETRKAVTLVGPQSIEEVSEQQ
jgi:insulysin